MKYTRKLITTFLKMRNRLSQYVNLIKFYVYNIMSGNNCVVQGNVYIKLAPTAEIIIGDNFYFSSAWNINALTSNKRGGIYATDNAKITIGNNVGMSSTILWCHSTISIGNNVKIGGNCILIDTDAHSLDYIQRRYYRTDFGISKPIVIGDDVLIGMNTIVLKGVTIGARSVIGAGSVVTKSIPPDSVACGNPARVIKSLL